MAAEAGQLQLNAFEPVVLQEALATGRGVAELVLGEGLLPAVTLAGPLRPEVVAGPGQALV